MKVFGKYGLGNILKILLQVVFVFGIVILIIFPIIISNTNISINPNIILFYPNAICLLLIIYQFVGLFNSLKEDNPFCENTVKKLKASQKISAVASLFWMFDFIFETFIVKNMSILVIIVLLFMFILFIGVTIALYILSELFNKAIEYKNENDLTI
ncbi:MAG TPA: DUF2975 domain-containing protein [Candidatus Scatovivens faecipullorum]|nr:DUF2975 domain-containing protein [Candidatus Scatovivens faecipullorum]